MTTTAPQIKYVSANVLRNHMSPFNLGAHIAAVSLAGTTLYGVNHPGDRSATKFASWKQSITGNKAFVLPSGVNAPQNTTGGALSAANQLRVVALVNDVPISLRARGDQVAPTSQFVVGAGGGTAAGEALVADGAQVTGAVVINLKAGGANTKTLLVGDTIETSDGNVYYVTETSQALNGATGVAVSITPPLQAAVPDADPLTIAVADGMTLIVDVAPAVNAVVEAWISDAADITTETGGAMTAGREYELECKSAYHAAGNVSLSAVP